VKKVGPPPPPPGSATVENLQQQTDSGGKCTHQEARETPLAAKAGV